MDDFVVCYNADNIEERVPTYSSENPNGRWRKYTLKEIKENHYKLDLKWMTEDTGEEDLSIGELLAKIKEKSDNIASAISELQSLLGEEIK